MQGIQRGWMTEIAVDSSVGPTSCREDRMEEVLRGPDAVEIRSWLTASQDCLVSVALQKARNLPVDSTARIRRV